MRQGPVVAVVGIAVFAAVGIATLPASIVAGHLPADLRADGVSGTVWNGGADSIRLRGTPLGSFSWTLEPGALAHGEIAFHVEIARPDGFVRGHVAAAGGGALTASDLDLALPITALDPEHASGGWSGRVEGTVQSARLERGWPVALVGRFTMRSLRPPGSSLPLGDYGVDFDGRLDTATQLVGRVRDIAAPLVVRAQLAIRRDRSYTLEGEVTPRPEAPPEVSQAVAFLGSPDAAGRRTFQITGTF